MCYGLQTAAGNARGCKALQVEPNSLGDMQQLPRSSTSKPRHFEVLSEAKSGCDSIFASIFQIEFSIPKELKATSNVVLFGCSSP